MTRLKLLAGMLLVALSSVTVQAQRYPSRPITWVVPFVPGGVTDSSARFVAKALSEVLNNPVVIENRGGAGAIVGTEYVGNAKPDGYTLLLGSSGPFATNPYIYKTLPYDPVKGFVFIHTFWESPSILITSANAPYKNVPELIAYAKANPGKINVGIAGVGTNPHLISEMLQQEAQIKLTYIPYKGIAPVLTDILAGNVDMTFDYLVSSGAYLDAGQMRALAVTGSERMKRLPDVPTLRESGYPNGVLTGWTMLAAPAGTPQPIVDKLEKAFGEALKKPEVVAFFETNNLPLMTPITGDALRQFVAKENAKFMALVKKAGVEPQ